MYDYVEGFVKDPKKYLVYGQKRIGRRVRYEIQKPILKLKYGDAAPKQYSIIRINPDCIKYLLEPNFYHRTGKKYGTFVIDGDWDITINQNSTGEGLIPFEDYWLYKYAQDVYNPTTNELKFINKKQYSNHNIRYRFDKLKYSFDQIRKKGYKSQQELGGYGWPVPTNYDEIRVNIGRNGNIIFDDGRHRFCAVKLLGIEQIPVRVFVRHKKWQEIRSEFAKSDSINNVSKNLQDFVSHPDIQDVL